MKKNCIYRSKKITISVELVCELLGETSINSPKRRLQLGRPTPKNNIHTHAQHLLNIHSRLDDRFLLLLLLPVFEAWNTGCFFLYSSIIVFVFVIEKSSTFSSTTSNTAVTTMISTIHVIFAVFFNNLYLTLLFFFPSLQSIWKL